MAEEGKGKIEKFNGMNFQWWKMQVEDYLYQKDLYLPLVGEKPKAINASAWAILDRKELATKNLISISGLDHERYFVAFDEKQWKVIKGSMVVARGERVGTLYTLSDLDIYAIRKKSDVYHSFKKWKALIENETWNKIKCLKSNNRGEYRDGRFQVLCSNNGIRLIRTVKRTPQENDLAERMNRTIMERARRMRIHADLPLQLWATAVDTTIYIINRNPASALNGGNPEEEWSGDEYGYRLWDYEHNKIIRSRDVIFDESRLYNHVLQEHGIKKENKEYMELDEPEDGQIPMPENPEVLDETTDTEIGTGDQQQVPETFNLRRSSQYDQHLNGVVSVSKWEIVVSGT
ncbi:hypothetical protein RJ639_015977 [Escallonia herrerae]|uniref:Integrase catalytic domain-containing protein n=1 Tax=Escallonia herrerae TaxID=1293975 RepID=A0AA89AKE1_9ASTE|nr:hypothetical protein RJ639_015977 [Escallonia herrerae]